MKASDKFWNDDVAIVLVDGGELTEVQNELIGALVNSVAPQVDALYSTELSPNGVLELEGMLNEDGLTLCSPDATNVPRMFFFDQDTCNLTLLDHAKQAKVMLGLIATKLNKALGTDFEL